MTRRRKLKLLVAVLVGLGVLALSSAIASAATGPGSLLDLVKGTTTVTVANGTQTTYLTGNPVTYDGSTEVEVRFQAPVYFGSAGSCDGNTEGLIFRLYDGSTEVGRIVDYRYNPTSSTTSTDSINDQPVGVEYLTPSAGSHTFHVTYTAINANLSGCVVQIDAGDGLGDDSPYAMLSVTQVNGSWGSSGSSTLAGLSDVTIASPAAGDVLTYNGATSKWTNQQDNDSSSGVAGASCGTSTSSPCSVNIDTSSNGGAALVDIRHLSGWMVGLAICALCMPLIAFVINRGSP